MIIRFADSYVDRLFAERDLPRLYDLIGVMKQQRELPEEFWLFCRLYEWCPFRSGIWQYYEGLPEEEFDRICADLELFSLDEIAEVYRLGRRIWTDEDQSASLDKWLVEHQEQVHGSAFDLILKRKDCLKDFSP
jgi:hypothetical protein